MLSANQHFEQDVSINLATACYYFDPAQKTMGPAAAAKLSPSLAAGFRIPLTVVLLTMTLVGFVLM